jgi:hypothetical protein
MPRRPARAAKKRSTTSVPMTIMDRDHTQEKMEVRIPFYGTVAACKLPSTCAGDDPA